MSQLSLTLLGPFSVTVGNTPITAFRTDKVRALLAYLALEADLPHTRHALAGLLWPDLPERHSLDNVRVTLHRLRQALDAAQPGLSEQVFTITRQTIQLNSAAVEVDVVEFEQLLAAAATPHQHPLHLNAPLLDAMARAVSLYQGELLAGFSLTDAETYEEWLLLRREQLAARALLAVKSLADAYETLGNFDKAHTFASRLLELDPYSEAARRQLMRVLTHLGLPDQALAQYATLRRLLRDELGVEPNAQTVALYEQIRSGKLVPTTLPQVSPVSPATPAPELSEIPLTTSLIGRTQELTQLEQWLVADGCRLVTVLGLGGVGKTTLVAHAARAVTGHFERVLWRSLLNAPPLDKLLAGLLQSLAGQTLVDLPETADEQFAMLFHYLHQQRVLLVLDNLESILDPAQAGRFRPGYELYDQLLWRMGTNEHRSVLLLTSRERPAAVIRLEGDTDLVRTLLLKGLEDAAGLELLAERGVAGPRAARSALIERYSGNPLALKLVADTVQELFAGDVESFLLEDTHIFDDVRTILKQQVDRLTELERTILFWLAIERDSVDAQTLRRNIVQPPGYIFLESLRSLQHRALIERHQEGFGLQNVVLEYLTERLVETVATEIYTEQLDLLHLHALLQSQASDDVRQGQIRLILAPIAAKLQAVMGKPALEEKLRNLVDMLRSHARHVPSYAAGNLLNLLLHLEIDVTGYDFSQLCVWQADLRGVNLQAVNLAGAELSGTTFTEDFGRIFAVAIHPQGELLAAGGAQGSVRIWSLPNGQSAGLLTGHTNAVTSVAWSRDGRLLASGSLDRRIRIWDWQSGRCLHVLPGHGGGTHAIAFSPDGTRLASGGQDHRLRLWDTNTGQQLDVCSVDTGTVLSIAFHPNGNMLAIGSLDHSIYLWKPSPSANAGPEQERGALPLLLDPVHGHDHQVIAVAFSPDGSLLASGSADTTVCLWDMREHRVRAKLRGHTHWVRCLAFSPDGARLFSGSADQTIRIWDVASQRSSEVWRAHNHTIRSLAIHPNGFLLVSGGLDDTIRIWDLRRKPHNRAIKTIYGHVVAIRALEFSPTGHELAAGDGKGYVRIWSLAKSQHEPSTSRKLPGSGLQTNCVTFRSDGQLLACADDDRAARIWDTTTMQLLGVLHGHETAVHIVRFAPQSNTLVTACYDGTIYLWDISEPAKARLIRRLSGHTREINDLLFTPDGKHFISGGADNTIRNWEFDTGRCVQVIEEENDHCKTLALHAQRSLLAAAGWSGRIRLFHLDSEDRLQPYHAFKAHATRIMQIAFSPDGRQIASGGQSGTVRLWDVETGKQLTRLHGHTQPVQAVAFHPSDHLLASGGEDESVRLWTFNQNYTAGKSEAILHIPGPYAGMNITGATGISEAQRSTLKALGAIDESSL